MPVYADDEFITGTLNNLFYMLGRLDPDPLNMASQMHQVSLLAEDAARRMDGWGLHVSAEHTRELHRTLHYLTARGNLPPAAASLHDQVLLIRQALHIELETTVFVNIGAAEARFYRDPLEDVSEGAQHNFASVLEDLREASRCFALRRSAASVFHAMRALEVGLVALGKNLDVPGVTNQNWHGLLVDIETAIKKIGADTHGPSWRHERQWYSDAAAQFRYVKDAWRNDVMHVHQSYDQHHADQHHARSVLVATRAFISHIATRLHD